MNCRRLLIVALLWQLTIPLAQAVDLPGRPPIGNYHPRPGSAAETWSAEMLAHRARIVRGSLVILEMLQKNPQSRRHFLSITREMVLNFAYHHDDAKVNWDHPWLESHGLSPDRPIPEIFAAYKGVIPVPEGTPAGDPRYTAEQYEFRREIDRLNAADKIEEDNQLRKYAQRIRQRLKLILLIADHADSAMRYDLQGRMRGSDYSRVQMGKPGGWSKLNETGKYLRYYLPTLEALEERVSPTATRWSQLMSDLKSEILVPRYKRDNCMGSILRQAILGVKLE